MAKLKRTVLSAVQHHVNPGYYPFWEYSVGMRRKPGFLWAVRWGVHRLLTQNTMLLVVMQYLYKYKPPILLHLIYPIQPAHFITIPAFSHKLLYQLLDVCSSKQGHSSKATNKPIGSSSSPTPSRQFQTPTITLIQAPHTSSKNGQNPLWTLTQILQTYHKKLQNSTKTPIKAFLPCSKNYQNLVSTPKALQICHRNLQKN